MNGNVNHFGLLILILSYGQPTELDHSVYVGADRLAASDIALETASAMVRHPLLGDDDRPEGAIERLGDSVRGGAASGVAAEAERRGLGVLAD